MEDLTVTVLPQGKELDIIYFVKKQDTIKSVSEKFKVDEKMILEDNNLSLDVKLQEGDILWIRRKNKEMYIVKPLDTIESIACKFNVTVEHIKQLNNTKTIFIGQKLYI